MAAGDLILYKPMVLLTQSASSPSGLTPVASQKQVSFGSVYRIYDTCDRLLVANNVLFDESDAYPINDNGTIYFLIDENRVMATDNFAP